jgi:hypothetical protein
VSIDEAVRLAEGPARTAAIAAWFQQLYRAIPAERVPVLVGGAAVELLTGGAYTTGDLDFVGTVPRAVSEELLRAGFRREGRHWIRDKGEVFLELPAAALSPGESSGVVRVGQVDVLVLSAEDLIADRLASWQFWEVAQDAVGALLLLRRQRSNIDAARLDAAAESKGVGRALESLLRFDGRLGDREPGETELEEWVRAVP